jgi:hypothetical protein
MIRDIHKGDSAMGEKGSGVQENRRNFRSWRVTFHYLKISDSLLQLAVSYSEHPKTISGKNKRNEY